MNLFPKSLFVRRNKYQLPVERYFPVPLSIGLGLVLGLLVAFLIVNGFVFFALALVVSIPVLILMIHYPLTAVLIWLLLMPFLPTNTTPPYVLWIVHRSLIPFALGITILSRMFRLQKLPRVKFGLGELGMVLYLAYAIVSTLFTQMAPRLYLFELYDKVFVPFAAFWLIQITCLREQDWKRLVPIMLVVFIAEILIGFWAKYTIVGLPSLWALERMGTRMSGTFANPNMYAHLLLLLMVFLYHYAMNQTNRIVRDSLILTVGVGLIAIFLTDTRACWLAGTLVLLGLLFIYPKPTFSLILLIALPLVFIFSFSSLASNSVINSEFSVAFERLTTEETIDNRIILSYAGQQMFLAQPVSGWGYGSYNTHAWRFIERVGNSAPTAWDIKQGSSHNTYLTILAELGVIGFLLYFSPLVWWLMLTIKVLPHLPKNGFWSWRLLAVIWLSLVAYLSIAQVIDMYYSWFSLGAFWLTMGLAANMVREGFGADRPESLENSSGTARAQ